MVDIGSLVILPWGSQPVAMDTDLIGRYAAAFGEQEALKDVPCLIKVRYWSKKLSCQSSNENLFLSTCLLIKVGFSFLVNISGKLFTDTRPSLKDVAGNTNVTLSQLVMGKLAWCIPRV